MSGHPDLGNWFEFLYVHIIARSTKAPQLKESVACSLVTRLPKVHGMVSHFAMIIYVNKEEQVRERIAHTPMGCCRDFVVASHAEHRAGAAVQRSNVSKLACPQLQQKKDHHNMLRRRVAWHQPGQAQWTWGR